MIDSRSCGDSSYAIWNSCLGASERFSFRRQAFRVMTIVDQHKPSNHLGSDNRSFKRAV